MKTLFFHLFGAVVVALVAVSVSLYNCQKANKVLRIKLINANKIMSEYEDKEKEADMQPIKNDTYVMYSARINK